MQYSFPYPTSSAIPPIKVPYVAVWTYSLTGPYSFESFNEYKSSGFGLYEFVVKHGLEVDQCFVHASVVQSWLFFGLASEALGRDINHQEFFDRSVTKDEPDSVIDLRVPMWFWTELCQRIEHLRTKASEGQLGHEWRRLSNCFIHAISVLSQRDCYGGEPESDEILNKVLLSVHMLQSVIAHALSYPSSYQQLSTNCQWRSKQLLTDRMLESGWCRKRLNMLSAVSIPFPALYFLSSIPPTHGHGADHNNCTYTRCLLSSALETPLHRASDCKCFKIRVPIDKVLRILEDGGVPLVRVTKTQSKLDLDIVRYTHGTIYIAISHVWSDRQFGSSENALPHCQVEHLYSLLEKLPIPFATRNFPLEMLTRWRTASQTVEEAPKTAWLFWLDTFCVPQDPAHDDLKRKAIDMMNLVYAAASQTLVVDGDMQNFEIGQGPTSDCSTGPPLFYGPTKEKLLDALAALCGSNWMGRAWTLQEGVITRSCVFQFHDSVAIVGILHVVVEKMRHDMIEYSGRLSDILETTIQMLVGKELWRSSRGCQKVDGEPLAGVVANDLLRAVKAMLDIQPLNDYPRRPEERVQKFMHAHRHLQSRSTSQPADLPLILVSLSGLNSNYVSRISETHERMRVLIYALGHVPLELLFSDCERLGGGAIQTDGWIPSEVVRQEFLGEQFLQLESEGFTFHCKDKSYACEFFLFSSRSTWLSRFYLDCYEKGSKEKLKFQAEALSREPDHDSSTPTQTQTDGCMLIDQSPGPDNVRGAQFLVTRIDNDKVFLKYVCPLRLRRIEDTSSDPGRDNSLETLNIIRSTPQLKFVLERSSRKVDIDPRPQNPEQYHNRIDFFIGWVIPWFNKIISPFTFMLWQKVFPNTWLAVLAASTEGYIRLLLIERALHWLCYRWWVSTYSQTWTIKGPWRWLERYMNFAGPISVKTAGKAVSTVAFVLCVLTNQFAGLMSVTLYWLMLFDRKMLGQLWTWAVIYHLSKLIF